MVAYEKIDLVTNLLENFNKIMKKRSKSFSYQSLILGRVKNKTGNLRLIIRSFFLGLLIEIIDTDNIVFLKNLLDKYDKFMEKMTIPIVKRILIVMSKQFYEGMPVTYCEEKFNLITKLCFNETADLKTIQQ